MSCIVAYSDGEQVWMGCDSLWVTTSGEGWKKEKASPKIFQRDGFLIGAVGSDRFKQLVQWYVKFPKLRSSHLAVKEEILYLEHYIGFDLSKEILKTLIKYQHVEISNQGEALSYQMLIARHGLVFLWCPDFSVSRIYGKTYHAAGSGGPLALSVLEALDEFTVDPRYRIRRALEIASNRLTNVGPPFRLFNEKDGEVSMWGSLSVFTMGGGTKKLIAPITVETTTCKPTNT